VPVIGPSDQLAKLQLERSEKQKLAEIDRRFREMILQDAGTWDLIRSKPSIGDFRTL
jgi:hypothetical protein